MLSTCCTASIRDYESKHLDAKTKGVAVLAGRVLFFTDTLRASEQNPEHAKEKSTTSLYQADG